MEQKLTHWIDKEFKEKMVKGTFELTLCKCKHDKALHTNYKNEKPYCIGCKLENKPICKKFEEIKIWGLKPNGFWLSVNGSWEDWLKYNWDSWLEGKICLSAYLDKDINLFIIESKKQFLDEFKKLTEKDYEELEIVERFMLKVFHAKLKEKYDGVWLKSKPFYRHRLDMNFMYFYAWDCESICVWNKDKIKFKENGNNI